MDRVSAAALIISVVIPFLMSIVTQVKFPRWVNFIITILVCAGAGMLTLYAGGALSWASWSGPNLLVTIGLIFAGSQAVYAAYWKGSPLGQSINEKTSY